MDEDSDVWYMDIEPDISESPVYPSCRSKNVPYYLDHMFTLEPYIPQPQPEIQTDPFHEEPFGLDSLFSKPPRNFLERMEIDQLVNDYQSEDSWVESVLSGTTNESRSKRKVAWTREDELLLAHFQDMYEGRKIPAEAWQRVARRLGRTVVSVTSKAAKIRKSGATRNARTSGKKRQRCNLTQVISNVIQSLPNQQGTRDDIIQHISSNEPPQGEWIKSVKQLLNKFNKTPEMFSLTQNYPCKPMKSCESMTDYILYSLATGPASLSELKSRIQSNFGSWLNYHVGVDSDLGTWEKTLSKKLRMCKYIVSKPAFYTQN